MPEKVVCLINNYSANWPHLYIGYKRDYKWGAILRFDYGASNPLEYTIWSNGTKTSKFIAFTS